MTAYKQTKKDIRLIIDNEICIPVAKLPIREMVTKVIPGKKYLCTDTGMYSEGKEGEALITRIYPDGTKDTYKNKKGPKYEFENGKTWDDLKPGESAFGKLKDGPEYDRVALLASPKDTVDAVWDETQKVLRKNAYITVIYMNNKFDMSEKGKWGSQQIVLNNNAGDLHPIDIKRKDSKGNPVVIGELPLTAKVQARKKELKEYVNKYYGGITPTHLKPLEKTLNATITHSLNKAKKKTSTMPKARGIGIKRILSQMRQK
ncbi:MAG: hypothetical protein IKP35_00290 [Alphaproteobacteria bacterium]|nr:hypothetical protein [Alphaproteobacteria bacterium]